MCVCVCVSTFFQKHWFNNTSWWYIQRTEGTLERHNTTSKGQEASKGVSSLTGRALNNKTWNAVLENAQGSSFILRRCRPFKTHRAMMSLLPQLPTEMSSDTRLVSAASTGIQGLLNAQCEA